MGPSFGGTVCGDGDRWQQGAMSAGRVVHRWDCVYPGVTKEVVQIYIIITSGTEGEMEHG